jgi:septal ring factor EnvC (AmiA/AmiB activator)
MKPTKNNFFCLDSNKTKMRFETEKKALNFIKFNSHEIEKETGKAPTRCYFCIACNSYHVTSNKIDYKIKSKTEHILEQYNQDINKKTYKEIQKQQQLEQEQEQLKKLLLEIHQDIKKLRHLKEFPDLILDAIAKIEAKINQAKNLKPIKGSVRKIKNIQITLKQFIQRNLP